MTVYQPQGLSKTIFEERYTIHPEETWENASRRLATHVASAESDGLKEDTANRFYDDIVSNRFMPGGRIWYGSGRPRAQILNCFALEAKDSREGWGKVLSDTIVISGMGGGVGINTSAIRPRGSKINGTGGVATGAVSLMNMINGVGDELMSGGARRMALMLDLNITHPDMPEFIDAKLEQGRLKNANVSIILDKHVDGETLQRKVRNNEDIDLMWGGQHYGKKNARSLWGQIVHNAWASGEPGVLNGALANKESNIFYHKPLVTTNPCGEIWLEEFGCCCLGALVLPRFVDSLGIVNWGQLSETIRSSVRFLDNVLSVNEYPLSEIRENCMDVRRIGLGIMGLHDMLIQMGYRYSSPAALAFIDDLMGFIKEEAYMASIDLAKEKGAFPVYEDDFLQSGFIQRSIKLDIQDQIARHGIRNCAILTVAPTGTTGMVSDVSTGLEPIFSAAYYRRYNKVENGVVTERHKELVINPWWDKLEKEGKDISVLEGAYDISPENHFAVQRVVQKHLDNSVSKTINLPEDYNPQTLSDLWLEYLPDLKGTTLYRAGSRGEEPLEAISIAEAERVVHGNHDHSEASITEQNMMDCPDGVCEIPEEYKVKFIDKEKVMTIKVPDFGQQISRRV